MNEPALLDTHTLVFISYSRRNSAFVDRLEADLKSRDFSTWVDRRKIEGGQRWKDRLKEGIDRCDILLIVLSPEAVRSRYVQMEFGYALKQEKLVIPLLYQHCPEVPWELNDIQWIDFEEEYQQGLDNLLIALNHSKRDLSASPKPTRRQVTLQRKPPTLVSPRPKQLADRNLDDIYREGVEALGQNNLELTAALWQQVLERDPKFRDGTLAPQLEDMLKTLHPIRVARLSEEARQAQREQDWRKAAGAWQALLKLEPRNSIARRSLEQCLRSQGEDASAAGDWELAISAWEALLESKKTDLQATRQRDLAQHNQKYMQYYNDARRFIEKSNLSAAQIQLKFLWREAPYYGDPGGLAIKARITRQLQSPATFEEEEKQRIAREERKRQEQIAREEQKRAAKAVWEEWLREEEQEWQRQNEEARKKQQEIDRIEQERQIAEDKVKWEQLEKQHAEREAERKRQAKERQKALDRERKSVYRFVSYELNTSPLTVWWSLFCLLSGTAFIANVLFIHPTQIWPLAVQGVVTTVVLAAVLAYLAGYYKAMGPISMTMITLMSGAFVFGLISYLLPSLRDYNHELKSHIFFNLILRSFWISNQINAGFIIGAASAICLFFLGYGIAADSRRSSDSLSKASLSGLLGGALFGLLCWALLAIFAWIFNWGWGFGSGWNLGLLGLAIGVATGTGAGAWLVILFQPRN